MRLCSILIPTRGRVDRLKSTIQSFIGRAKPESFDIWIKIDDDDAQTLARTSEFAGMADIKIRVGPRLSGFGSLHIFQTEMADECGSKWVWMFNDDAVLEGIAWDGQLAEMPTEGFIVQPETHRLGGSVYHKDIGGPFPIVPNGCWKKFGQQNIPSPADTGLDHMLRIQAGWQTHWLRGVGFWHNRDEREIEQSRKL